jgi:hypothetical protein
MTTRVSAEYQPTNYDNLKISASTYEGSNNIDARYTHDF